MTDRSTFESLNNWISSISEHADNTIIKYLIGNKCDLTEERKVTKEEAEKIGGRNKMIYFETSAKANINVKECIENIAKEIYEKLTLKEESGNINLKETKKEIKKAGVCC